MSDACLGALFLYCPHIYEKKLTTFCMDPLITDICFFFLPLAFFVLLGGIFLSWRIRRNDWGNSHSLRAVWGFYIAGTATIVWFAGSFLALSAHVQAAKNYVLHNHFDLAREEVALAERYAGILPIVGPLILPHIFIGKIVLEGGHGGQLYKQGKSAEALVMLNLAQDDLNILVARYPNNPKIHELQTAIGEARAKWVIPARPLPQERLPN